MSDKKRFTRTPADVELLDTMQGTGESIFANPMAHEVNRQNMVIVWRVLGEKHGFKPETVEKHPAGEPNILAESI